MARWRLRRSQLVIVEEAILGGHVRPRRAGDGGTGGRRKGPPGWRPRPAQRGRSGWHVRCSCARPRRAGPRAERRTSVPQRLGDKEPASSYGLAPRMPSTPTRPTTASCPATGTRCSMPSLLRGATTSQSGRTSLMIAGDLGTVSELNARARADRISAGQVVDEGVSVAGGGTAGVGDQVRTRQNNRRLTSGRRWVRNGDRWSVTATFDDGSMTVQAGEWCRTSAPAERLRARARRAGVRLDCASRAGSDRGYGTRHRLAHNHPRGALRLGYQRAGGQL